MVVVGHIHSSVVHVSGVRVIVGIESVQLVELLLLLLLLLRLLLLLVEGRLRASGRLTCGRLLLSRGVS